MNIGVLLLLIATFLIAYAFSRGALAFWKYYRLLQNNSDNEGAAIHQQFPKSTVWMKVIMPITAAGLSFVALAATMMFVYFAWRFFSNT